VQLEKKITKVGIDRGKKGTLGECKEKMNQEEDTVKN